jgi:CPA2 family monovalent cation:H+ antiporter-2
VFFTTVGMELDIEVLVNGWWVILLGAASLIILKSSVIGATSWALGATGGVAASVGLALAQAGEFSLVLIYAAADKNVIDNETTAAAIAIVIASLILTPALLDFGERLATRMAPIGTAPWIATSNLRERREAVDADTAGGPHVIVAGFGPIGRKVAEEVERAGASCTVVELNPKTVESEARRGRSVIFGDVSNPEILEMAGLARAKVLVLTIPDDRAVARASTAARRRAPGVFIAARQVTASKTPAAGDAGPDHLTIDEIAAAKDLLRAVARRLRRAGADDLDWSADSD